MYFATRREFQHNLIQEDTISVEGVNFDKKKKIQF